MTKPIQKSDLKALVGSSPTCDAPSIVRKTIIEAGENPYRVEAHSIEEAEIHLSRLKAFMAPATRNEILQGIAALMVRTAAGYICSEDRQATLKIYAEKLALYPGAIVIDVLKNIPALKFPSLAAIEAAINADHRFRKTRKSIEAIEVYLKDPARATRAFVRVTPERMDTIRKAINEKHAAKNSK